MIEKFWRRALASALVVGALGVAGVQIAPAAHVIFAAHTLAAPAVNSQAMSVPTPLFAGESVGTATATNAPTAWAITGCSASCASYFVISNTGAITLTSAGASALAVGVTYTLTLQATNSRGSGSNTNTVTVRNSYAGMLDRFSAIGATWGFSTYALSQAYVVGGGAFAVIRRQSDSATLTLGFDASYRADAATLVAFGCSGSNPCFVATLYDQIGGHDASCANVRVFVGSNGRVALSPQEGGYCAAPYNAAFTTAKQELFAVAQPNFSDSRGVGELSASAPTVITTGDVASGSGTISNLPSLTGLSATNDLYDQPARASVADSEGCLAGSGTHTGHTYLNSLSGSTADVESHIAPAQTSPACSKVGDTLTFMQAVLGGTWASNGPNSLFTNAYFSFSLGLHNTTAGPTDIAESTIYRNGNESTPSYAYGVGINAGNGMRGVMGVWDFASFDGTIYFDGVPGGPGLAPTANITYPSNRELVLFADPQHLNAPVNNAFEQMVLINQTYSSRASVSSWLMVQFGIAAFPKGVNGVTTANGYGVFPMLMASYPGYDGAFGYNTFIDAKGISWSPQGGGYAWPSIGWGSNVTNSPATYFIFNLHDGDADLGINYERRAEISSNNASIAPGQSASYFAQTRFVDYTTQYMGTAGTWCLTNQVHYNDGPSEPDIFVAQCDNDQFQLGYHNVSDADPTHNHYTKCGAPIAIVPGQVLAIEVELTWSTGHTTDSFAAYVGVNGSSLSLLCSVSGALFSTTETGAYMKQGIYEGDTGQQPGTISYEVMNPSWSNTANAFAALRTTQPALPSHP